MNKSWKFTPKTILLGLGLLIFNIFGVFAFFFLWIRSKKKRK